MRGDDVCRNGSVLLARWREAARLEGASLAEPLQGEPTETALDEEQASALAPPSAEAPSLGEVVTRLDELEAAIGEVVPSPSAQALVQILAGARAALVAQPNLDACRALLAELDLVEDVLDAVLLTGPELSQAPGREREPP